MTVWPASGVAVGGAKEGLAGPVKVLSTNKFTALLDANACAAPGPRTLDIKTGAEQLQRASAITITGTGWGRLDTIGPRLSQRSQFSVARR